MMVELKASAGLSRIFFSLLFTFMAFFVTGCSDQSGDKNLFRNASLEDGDEPWFAFVQPDKPYWFGFDVTDERAHDGVYSAKLELGGEDHPSSVKIAGLIQEVPNLKWIPRRLSGWYRLENWHRGVQKQYLQVVVMTFGGDETPKGLQPNWPVQLAYVLDGITEAPFKIRNRIFQFLGKRKPVEDKWVYFEFDLADDFREKWGVEPENIDKFRVLFEVRYDDGGIGKDQASADVYFDDLYLGD